VTLIGSSSPKARASFLGMACRRSCPRCRRACRDWPATETLRPPASRATRAASGLPRRIGSRTEIFRPRWQSHGTTFAAASRSADARASRCLARSGHERARSVRENASSLSFQPRADVVFATVRRPRLAAPATPRLLRTPADSARGVRRRASPRKLYKANRCPTMNFVDTPLRGPR